MEQIEKLIETRTKAIDDASEMLSGLKLVDTNALEFNRGGSMYKHLNIPEEKSKNRTDPETSNVLGILASKEVLDKTSFEEYQLEFAQKFDIRPSIESKNDLQNAPFKQIKRTELDTKSKDKITLKRQQEKHAIKTREIEVMPLPPDNYERLQVQQINLTESMELQKQQERRVKEARLQNAIDKLLEPNTNSSSDKATKINFESDPEYLKYRENEEEPETEEDEEDSHPLQDQDSDDDDDD